MATILVTLARPLILNGAVRAAGAYGTPIDTVLAASLVWRGDATYTGGAPASTVVVNDGININAAQIADSTAGGRALLTSASSAAARASLGSTTIGDALFVAANLDAALAALGVSLGAADSGGTGKKALVVLNAVT